MPLWLGVCRTEADGELTPLLVSASRDAVFPPKLRFQAFERFSAAANQVHSFGPKEPARPPSM